MKREFEVKNYRNNKVKKEFLEVEIKGNDIIFNMQKELYDGRQIYNKSTIDKQAFLDFLEEANE